MLGAHNGLAQRKTATQMHQQNPQIGLGGFILAQSPQSARGFSLLSPIGRKERHQQVPIFSEGVMRRVFHTPRLLQVIAPVNKQVSAYGPTAWVNGSFYARRPERAIYEPRSQIDTSVSMGTWLRSGSPALTGLADGIKGFAFPGQ